MQLIRSCWRRWVRDPGVSHDATSHATSPTTSHATSGARDDAQLRKPGEPVAVRAAERGWRTPVDDGDASLSEVHASIPVPRNGWWLKRLVAFSGPGYLVSVGYMDPGNWATD